jgi:hypothetical protein|tara:strand:- start:469 stop:900 length:432 start_codon:yes stop_codon:yes gene_type:complete
MAITQTICTSFKAALLGGEMDFSSDTSQTFKIALYTSSATLGASTTAYSTTNEASGTGYTAGGATLPVASGVTSSGTVAYVDFTDVTWSSSSITARGALIYKSASGNPAVAVIDFGGEVQSSSGDFTISWPAPSATNAIVIVA